MGHKWREGTDISGSSEKLVEEDDEEERSGKV